VHALQDGSDRRLHGRIVTENPVGFLYPARRDLSAAEVAFCWGSRIKAAFSALRNVGSQ
jgi:hypothetical protein